MSLATSFALAILAGQAAYAQEPWQPPLQNEDVPQQDSDPGEDGTDLFERGMNELMDNLMRDLGPGLGQLGQDFSGALDNLSPLLKDLGDQIDDLRYYQAPERLENGDIIMRRRADAPPPPPLGENLRDLTTPDKKPGPVVPTDPYAPEFEL